MVSFDWAQLGELDIELDLGIFCFQCGARPVVDGLVYLGLTLDRVLRTRNRD